MNRRLFGALGVVTVFTLTVGSCKSDPFSNVHGTPAAVVTDFSYLQLPIGGSAAVKASIVDATATPLAVPITFTACTGDVSVATDTSYHPVPATSAQAIVTAVTANPSCVVVAGGGVKDTIQVAVLPQAFAGALSSATPKGGDTLTITSTTLLKFDTSKVAVSFAGAGTGSAGVIVSKTPDVVKVLVPFGAAGPLTIAGIKVTYVSGLVVTLPTSGTVTQTGDFWVPDTGYASAPTMPTPSTTGEAFKYVTQVPSILNDANCGEGTGAGGVGKCTIFKYVANGTDSLTFSVNWTPATVAATDASDIDIYSCGSAGVAACFEGGGAGAAGATAKTPEAFTIKPAAGTHYFVVEQYSTPEDANVYVTITKRN